MKQTKVEQFRIWLAQKILPKRYAYLVIERADMPKLLLASMAARHILHGVSEGLKQSGKRTEDETPRFH